MTTERLDSLKSSGIFKSRDAVYLELLETAESFINKMQLISMQQSELQKRVEQEISLLNTEKKVTGSEILEPDGMAKTLPLSWSALLGFCLGVLLGSLSILAIVYYFKS
ncbi:hypothetical protein RP726_05420 [Candidatus Methylospira mobilis]|uniref:hypothetical protein n=1 Tax=Candidatus Methylospira mobilis TaxID=1808979 RepID=UPI0028E1CDA0|nr:hypothetical protein [Candidatus Methylospira mobilis]WNV05851.1 hypothetical protein RP726_05420 [Candidatus Methylospira mobilis]